MLLRAEDVRLRMKRDNTQRAKRLQSLNFKLAKKQHKDVKWKA